MNLLKFLGWGKKSEEPANYAYAEVLHLWEDDYLMIELLPEENLDFVKNETKRISDFSGKHFDGAGFSEITPVGEVSTQTSDKQILLSDVVRILEYAGLERVLKYYDQQAGLLEGNKAPMGFGTQTFAVICEAQGEFVTHIWITGKTSMAEDERKLEKALLALGAAFRLIAADWNKCTYYELTEESQVEEFVKNSC